ncbi:MAG: hypothetical protein GX025_08235 [Clostridiales bacterium]|nr:hypothetical protein [Clostridiales bacterium]
MKKLSEAIENTGFPQWITDKYIYLIIFLYPLFLGFRGYAMLTISKFFFFSILTVLWLLSIFVFHLKAKRPFKAEKQSPTAFFILLYLLFCLISAILSPYGFSVIIGEGRFDGLLTISLCCLIFFGVFHYGSLKKEYIYAFSISGFLCCLIAVLQLLGKNPLWLFPTDYSYYDAGTKYSSEFLSTIGNADLFSGYLCILLPLISVYYIVSEKRPLPFLAVISLGCFCLLACRVASGILAALCLMIGAAPFVLNTGERLRKGLEVLVVAFFFFGLGAAFKGLGGDSKVFLNLHFSKPFAALLILSLFFLIARLCLEKKEFKKKTLNLFISSLSVLVLVSGLCIVYLWSGEEGSVYEISQAMRGNLQEDFGSSRILIWREVLSLVPERLLFGGGSGTLALRIDLGFSRYVEETGRHLQTYVDNAHNAYLGILVNTGLFSLLCYLAAQLSSLFAALKSAKYKPLCLCLISALICYWMQSFFSLGLFIVSPISWVLWGLLASETARTPKKI